MGNIGYAARTVARSGRPMIDISEVPMICEKMRAAFHRGSYNKDGRAIRATCKHFNLKYTYTAINDFLKGTHE